MLKILRVTRLSKVIRNMKTRSEIKAGYKVLQLVFYLFLFVHVLACFWYYNVEGSEIWIPNKDFIWAGTPLTRDVYTADLIRRYWIALYTAFYLFHVGEAVPRTTNEIILASLMMLISAMANAIIFGSMTVLAQEMNKKQIKF